MSTSVCQLEVLFDLRPLFAYDDSRKLIEHHLDSIPSHFTVVMPAQAGIQTLSGKDLDSRFLRE